MCVARQLSVTYVHRVVISFCQDITLSFHVTKMNFELFKVKVPSESAGICFKEVIFGAQFHVLIFGICIGIGPSETAVFIPHHLIERC